MLLNKKKLLTDVTQPIKNGTQMTRIKRIIADLPAGMQGHIIENHKNQRHQRSINFVVRKVTS